MIYPLNAPLLEYLVLSVISQRDSYGYEISQQLKGISITKDSTLYPVLKRLQEHDFVITYDQQIQGRNRRYYRITPEGTGQLKLIDREWQDFTTAISRITHRTQDDPFQEGKGNNL